jgi:putative NIF3 family GTP cyclohydrolase 1 type 2
MVNQTTLAKYCHQYLQVDKFTDYCPNGLQIQGKSDIKKIISGVSANQDLIDAAIDEKTDALFVHHGFFWKNEAAEIIGIKKNRIKALLDNDINLFAYHLPLDAHPTVGNNIQLAQRFGIKNLEPIGDTFFFGNRWDLLGHFPCDKTICINVDGVFNIETCHFANHSYLCKSLIMF